MNQAGLLPPRLAAAAICAAMLVLASCSPNPVPPKASGAMTAAAPSAPGVDLSEFDGTFWRLTQLEGRDKSRSGIILRITGDTIDFNPPAYIASFPFRYEKAHLVFSPAWKREGTPVADAATFERILQGGLSYRTDGEQLSFVDTEGRPVIVAVLVHPTGPENREWRIVRYRSGGGVLVAPTSSFPPRVTFLNGTLDGGPGCGAFLGGYRRSGGYLEIATGWLLIGACDQPDFAAQNTAVVNALSGRRRVEISGDRMQLKDENGLVQVELTTVPASAGHD